MRDIAKVLLIGVIILKFSIFNVQGNEKESYYNRLYYTCKVWGFAKYFNVNISTGTINWDDELIKVIPLIKVSESNIEFNNIINEMLNNTGNLVANSLEFNELYDTLNNTGNLDWFYDDIFSDDNKDYLELIKDSFYPHENRFLDQAFVDGNPTFYDDTLYYSSNEYPGEELRLLSLFRYWNIINYFFPYKYIMDQDWDTTLVEFIPKFSEAKSALEYNLAFLELATRINDSHGASGSKVIWDWNGRYYPPFDVSYLEGKTVVSKIIEGTPIAIGDIIKKIDGFDIEYLRDSLRKYAYGSNNTIIERTINAYILPGDSGEFEITLQNANKTYSLNLERNMDNINLYYQNGDISWKNYYDLSQCNVGYVDMGVLEKEEIEEMFEDLSSTEAIIFDVRSYPNGTLWDLVPYLYWSSIHIANFTVPDINIPGRMYWKDAVIGYSRNDAYGGNKVLLFNEHTQSQAEYTVMGLEHDIYTKIGSQTAGADGNVSYIYLPGGIVTVATFLGVYYPDYRQTQRIGIVPDYEIRPTIEGIRNGEDEVLNYALSYLGCELTDMDEMDMISDIILSPNPAKNLLNVKLNINNIDGYIIEIYDIQGKLVKKQMLLSDDSTIDIQDLKSGIYLLKLESSENFRVSRFVKL